MTSKRKLRERIADLELREVQRNSERPVLETLQIDFVRRTVRFEGRTVHVESDGYAMPILRYRNWSDTL